MPKRTKQSTRGDILSALEHGAAFASESDAMTTREIAAKTGRSIDWVREHLKEAVARGAVKVERVRVTDLAGRPMMLPAYKFLAKGGS